MILLLLTIGAALITAAMILRFATKPRPMATKLPRYANDDSFPEIRRQL